MITHSERAKLRRARLASEGRCIGCAGARGDQSRRYCERCREKYKTMAVAAYRACVADGRCPRCKRKRGKEKRVYCAQCRKVLRAGPAGTS